MRRQTHREPIKQEAREIGRKGTESWNEREKVKKETNVTKSSDTRRRINGAEKEMERRQTDEGKWDKIEKEKTDGTQVKGEKMMLTVVVLQGDGNEEDNKKWR